MVKLNCVHVKSTGYRSDDVTNFFFLFFFFFFLHFSVLDTMYWWTMMKNIHSPNLVGIGSWGPEIWPHEYLISPSEISVKWPGSKQLWTRLIYTDFNMGLIRYSCSRYLGSPWTNSCQIWCVRIFHHVLLKYGHESAEMQKRKFDDVKLQYSIGVRIFVDDVFTAICLKRW